jgi:serine/threonine-protein kinase ATR
MVIDLSYSSLFISLSLLSKDTLRTHVRGILTRNPEWKLSLEDLQVEGAWMVGDWNEVRSFFSEARPQTESMAIARVLLAMQSSDTESIREALSQARLVLGKPISAAGAQEYRRSYDAALNLHLLHELEMIQSAIGKISNETSRNVLSNLSRSLNSRFEASQPYYRVRESILSMRRIAFGLRYV